MSRSLDPRIRIRSARRDLIAAASLSAWLMMALTIVACAGEPAGARVEIVEPLDGTVIRNAAVRVVLAAHGIDVVAAGVERPNSGHYHLYINHDLTPTDEPIPAGRSDVVYIGGGQSEHLLDSLSPGQYVVIARIGDAAHVPIQSVRTDTVRFTIDVSP